MDVSATAPLRQMRAVAVATLLVLLASHLAAVPAESCLRTYVPPYRTSCRSVAAKYNTSIADIMSWNPIVCAVAGKVIPGGTPVCVAFPPSDSDHTLLPSAAVRPTSVLPAESASTAAVVVAAEPSPDVIVAAVATPGASAASVDSQAQANMSAPSGPLLSNAALAGVVLGIVAGVVAGMLALGLTTRSSRRRRSVFIQGRPLNGFQSDYDGSALPRKPQHSSPGSDDPTRAKPNARSILFGPGATKPPVPVPSTHYADPSAMHANPLAPTFSPLMAPRHDSAANSFTELLLSLNSPAAARNSATCEES
ncbi:hypothetical protein SeMB42_g02450 [Synchytrium endobioticum]|uniref:LysM domain-containing protein n=1 Tax=Synchytrium endobioticum TaxID=286115 RepID=A0A507DGC9_9FUNG|nr:hypothetical protein SeLEV6574_g02665 [Synchytrium endobioticum]TPX49890.1 hypothetical protein SeMB42_g02450 [Synchytrium endobioticum]